MFYLAAFIYISVYFAVLSCTYVYALPVKNMLKMIKRARDPKTDLLKNRLDYQFFRTIGIGKPPGKITKEMKSDPKEKKKFSDTKSKKTINNMIKTIRRHKPPGWLIDKKITEPMDTNKKNIENMIQMIERSPPKN